MFQWKKKLTPEDKINLMAGFLPAEDQVLQIIAATGFNAEFTVINGDDMVVPLMAWAFLKNGAVIPLCFEHRQKGYVNACTIKGFHRIVHDHDLPEEDEEEGGIDFKPDF